jgi:Dolichyl-phosphate-mannose-protein mannosyltransferase
MRVMAPGAEPPQDQARRTRGWLLLFVVLANPLLYLWGHTTGGAFPDSIAYLSMARELVDHGHLYLASSGHVDQALILPPLYPLLVGLASKLYADPILVSQWLNGALLILAMLPLFLLIERAANPWLAAAAVLAIQWQPSYILYGTSSLTEAAFVLAVSAVAYGGARLFSGATPRPSLVLALGGAVGLAFLTRQIGAFLLPVLLALLVILYALDRASQDVRRLVLHGALLTTGFAAVIGAYAVLLHAQTGQMPWTHSYRMHGYVVTAEAAAPGVTVPYDSYTQLYVERRAQRRLLPDASEMLGFVVPRTPPAADPAHWLASPSAWARNLRGNLAHAHRLLGPTTLALTLLGLLACLLRPGVGPSRAARLALAGCALGYVLFLALLTGLVRRYVEVALPLLVGLAAVGVHDAAAWGLRGRALPRLVWPAIASVAAAVLVLTLPQRSFAGSLMRKAGERNNPLVSCRTLLQPGAGVFSFHPIEAYLVGGSHRVVPNASLAQIAAYGRRTGTRWLLFRSSETTAREMDLYADAPWLQHPAEALVADANFAPRCGSPELGAVLFEIVERPGGASAPRD